MSAIDKVDKNVAISMVEKAISLSMKGVKVEKLISAKVAIAMPEMMFRNTKSLSKSKSKNLTIQYFDFSFGSCFSSLAGLEIKNQIKLKSIYNVNCSEKRNRTAQLIIFISK